MSRGFWWARLAVALGGLAPTWVVAQEPSRLTSLVTNRPRPLLGVVVAQQTLDVVCQVEGRIREVKARLGQRVEEGQVLAVLELEPLRLELNARQATVRAVEAEQERAAILLAQARQRLQREQRIREYSAAEALETAQNEVSLAEADLALARARIAEAQTRLQVAERDLSNASIRAPFTGSISEQYVTPGMLVGRTTPVLRLVSEALQLRFAIPESLAPSVRPGSPLVVRLTAVGVNLTGTVERLSPEVDPASRHQKAEARLSIPEELRNRITTGLLAEVSLEATPLEAQGAAGPP